jgi:hypothetical protein
VHVDREEHAAVLVRAADCRDDDGIDQGRDGAAVHHACRLVELAAVRQPHARIVRADLFEHEPDEAREVHFAEIGKARPHGGAFGRERSKACGIGCG